MPAIFSGTPGHFQNCNIRQIQKRKRAASEAFKFSNQKGNSRSIQFQILENYRPTATLEAINLGYWKMEGLQPAFFIGTPGHFQNCKIGQIQETKRAASEAFNSGYWKIAGLQQLQ